MAESGQRLRDMHSEGTLHRKLLIRVRILTFIGIVLLGISLFDIVSGGFDLWLGIVFGAVGFVLGVTVFSRMSKVVWDEKLETVQTGRMDIVAVLALVLYVAFDIGIRHYFTQISGLPMVTGYVFAALGGALLGRSIGTRLAIYRALGTRGN